MLPIVLGVVLVAALAVAAVAVRYRRPATPVQPGPEPVEAEPARRRDVVLTAAVPAPATISGEVTLSGVAAPRLPRLALVSQPAPGRSSGDTLDTLDALLAELESATVRIDGADELDEGSVATLEGLAERLEAAAESLANL
jgi:hypothetical protein